jgi:hypothetical protein
MWKKIAISGAVAAAVVGAGTAAVALSGTGPSASSITSGSGLADAALGTAGAGHGRLLRLADRIVHGQFVTKAADGSFVTHDVIHGSVTSVSPSAITVHAADGTSESFTVNSATKVRMRTSGKGTASSIGNVKDGDTVYVLGTGTGTATATFVIDVK